MRWRLTLFYCGLLAALSLALGLFVYSQFEASLINTVQKRLQDRATLIQAEAGRLLGGVDNPAANPKAYLAVQDLLAQSSKPDDIYTALLDPSGHAVLINPPLVALDGPGIVADTVAPRRLTVATGILTDTLAFKSLELKGPPYYLDTTIERVNGEKQASEHAMAQVIPMSVGKSSEFFYVVLVASLSDVDRTLASLRLFLLTGLAAELFLGALVGLPLTRLGLRPLERMAATATQIGRGALSRRVVLPGGDSLLAADDDEVRQLARAFNAMLDRIESAFEAQQRSESRSKQFAADASHELRSPLTVLGGYLDVLLMGAKDDPAEAERILRAMKRESDRLSRLVVDLLLLTRIDASGSACLHLEPLRLVDLVSRVVEDMRLLVGPRELVLEIAPQADDAWIRGDPDGLIRVLVNLLDNAIRYTQPDGHIIVGLKTGLSPAGLSAGDPRDYSDSLPVAMYPLPRATISVSDDGCGIATEQLPHVFDRFYRADESRARHTGNAGLGLAIARSIVEAHSGQIRVDSRPDRGTSFTIDLPLNSQPPVNGKALSPGAIPAALR